MLTLCLKAEAGVLGPDSNCYAPSFTPPPSSPSPPPPPPPYNRDHGVILRWRSLLSLGGSSMIQRITNTVGAAAGGRGRGSSIREGEERGTRGGLHGPSLPPESPPSTSSSLGDASATGCSSSSSSPLLELKMPAASSPLLPHNSVGKHNDRGSREDEDVQKFCYRSQLEQEVQKLQKQLQEEINLHVALANAVEHNALSISRNPYNLPDKAQELLANIATLEATVSKLEEELVALHFRLTQEQNERHLAEYNMGHSPSLSLALPPCASRFSWGESMSFPMVLKSSQMPCSVQPILLPGCGYTQTIIINRSSDLFKGKEEGSRSCGIDKEGKEMDAPTQGVDAVDDLNENFLMKNLWQCPNQLSEEMVQCMRNIFLCLSKSSTVPSKNSFSECTLSPSSPVGHLSISSLTSFSDSSLIPKMVCSPSAELEHCCDVTVEKNTFDPYRLHGKVKWTDIGSYRLASEVSWMTVGKQQLEYAANALKRFRFLVEQLARVNPSHMTCSEKLAFWINLYNALIMHAYLAYGVPRSDIKLFSLMQKAFYTVGGQTFSAADIEYVILKVKPPAYRPQIALMLALHKFKMSEDHRKYSVDNPEPLVVFALSCGMYSSPAVRIFTASKVKGELQSSFRDYVQASVGISDKGKMLVPKLLHCFAKSVVEDSLLVDWICRFLSPEQVAQVRDSTSHRKERLLGAQSFSVVPFDSRFRYLFLPDSKGSWSSP